MTKARIYLKDMPIKKFTFMSSFLVLSFHFDEPKVSCIPNMPTNKTFKRAVLNTKFLIGLCNCKIKFVPLNVDFV